MQPFSPVKHNLDPSERLLVYKGAMYKEDGAVYKNLGGFAKFFHGRRYSHKRVLNSLHTYAVKYSSKATVNDKTETLAANLQGALKMAKKNNDKAAKSNCCFRLFSSTHSVNLDLYKADLKQLQSKIRAAKIEAADNEYNDLSAEIHAIEAEDLPYDKIATLAATSKATIENLEGVRKGGSKKSKALIDEHIANYNDLLVELNNKIQEIDLNATQIYSQLLEENKHAPKGIRKLLEKEQDDLQTFSNDLTALNIAQFQPLQALITLPLLIAQCKQYKIEKVKADEDKAVAKIKLIMQDLKSIAFVPETYSDDVAEAVNTAKVKLANLRNKMRKSPTVVGTIDSKIAKINFAYSDFISKKDTWAMLGKKQMFKKPETFDDAFNTLFTLGLLQNHLKSILTAGKLDFCATPLANLLEHVGNEIAETEELVERFKNELNESVESSHRQSCETIANELEKIKLMEDGLEKIEELEKLYLYIKDRYSSITKNWKWGDKKYQEPRLKNRQNRKEAQGLVDSLMAATLADVEADEGINIPTLKIYLTRLAAIQEHTASTIVDESEKKLAERIARETEEISIQIKEKWEQELLPLLEQAIQEYTEEEIQFDGLFERLNRIEEVWRNENKEELEESESWIGQSFEPLFKILRKQVYNPVIEDYENLKYMQSTAYPALKECQTRYQEALSKEDGSLPIQQLDIKIEAELTKFLETESKVKFIQYMKASLEELKEEVEKAKVELLNKHTAWKDEIQDYLNIYQGELKAFSKGEGYEPKKPTILDLVDNVAVEFFNVDNFLKFFNSCMEAKKIGFKPLELKSEEEFAHDKKDQPDVADLLEKTKLLYLEDFQENNIYSREALKAYVVENAVRLYGYLKFSGWFKL